MGELKTVLHEVEEKVEEQQEQNNQQNDQQNNQQDDSKKLILYQYFIVPKDGHRWD